MDLLIIYVEPYLQSVASALQMQLQRVLPALRLRRE
jgi:hypothetical protein